MRRFSIPLFLLSLLLCQSKIQAKKADFDLEAEIDKIYAFADDTVKQRLSMLDQSIVDHRHDAAVRRVIGLYVERWRYGSERLLARSAAYFPYFSRQLEERGMPDALKYLTITESALRPYALSHVGAAGFWQLMPGTARDMGLVVSDTLDERLDLAIGTDAGLEYLQTQHERYGNWALAMAAYNSGPGRVNRAKRRSGSDDYWKLRKYLPRETRSYVPGYIAAAYLMTYFSAHELYPAPMDPDLQITEIITVYDFISLHRVAMVTGLNPARIIELNPAYLNGYIPASSHGRSLRIPKRTANAMRHYLDKKHQSFAAPALPWISPRLHRAPASGEAYYQQYTTYPSAGDTSVLQIATWLQQDPHQLMIWSAHGPMDTITTDQSWHYLKPKENLTFGEVSRAQPRLTDRLKPSDINLSWPKSQPRLRAQAVIHKTTTRKTKKSSAKRTRKGLK